MESEYHFKFEDLLVYQKAMDFAEFVDSITKDFPPRELYALSSQFRRASDSIGLNIAEGYTGSDAQFIKHINHAIHSSNECISANEKAFRRKYISFEQSENIRKEVTIIQKMLTGLRSKIRLRLNKK